MAAAGNQMASFVAVHVDVSVAEEDAERRPHGSGFSAVEAVEIEEHSLADLDQALRSDALMQV